MAVIRIPTPLRTYTGGQDEVTVSGATVAELVDNLDAAHPGLKERLVDGEGQIRRFINVFVNEDDIRHADGVATAVGDGDEVSIFPAIAGGGDHGA